MFIQSTATSYLTFGVIGCILLWYLLFLIKNIKLFKFAFANKGFFVPVVPFVGTVYLGLFAGDRVNVLSSTDFFKKIFGFPCIVWMGHHYVLFSNDPEEIKIVLNHPKCIDKPTPFYENFKMLAQNSLFLLSHTNWRLRRKHFMKSYKPKILKSYQQIFYEQSCELVEELKKNFQENLFDVCNRYSFANFFLTSVGLEEKVFDRQKMQDFGHLLEQMQELSSAQVADPITPYKIWMRFFPNGRKVAKIVESSKKIVGEIIQKKKAQRADLQEYTENANELPLMDSMLYENGKQMSDNDIFQEMLLFSAAATETSGNVMAFCFTCLGMFPEVQETLYNEIMTLIGHNSISNDDLPNLKYTEAVILETLRLFPALPMVGRYFSADIDVGTKTIPKGTNYIISVFHLHRDSKYWENPMQFDPTRFMPGKVEKIQPYSYLPFSGGPRDCIGKAQAMLLLKTTMANVVRNFKLTSTVKSLEDISLSSCLTMKSTHPLYCRFILR